MSKNRGKMKRAYGQHDRRRFLSFMVKSFITFGLGNALIGCTTFDANKDYSKIPPEKFAKNGFDRWFKTNKLYNSGNPNLKTPYFTMHTFKAAFHHGWTPGIGYTVPRYTVMVAVAPGKVIDIHELHTGRAGGIMVGVAHPKENEIKANRPLWAQRMDIPFVSYYAHLDKIFVKVDQTLKRGDVIGNVTEHHRYAKLMLWEEGNWVDPDNYLPGT